MSDWSSDVSTSDLGSCASNSLTADTAGLISVLVMAGLLGDVEHPQPAMTASLLKRFCRTSRTLPIRSDQSTREVWWQKTIRSQECGDPALRRGGSIYWPRPAISSSNADSIRPGWPKSPVHPASRWGRSIGTLPTRRRSLRSEEHTSELQSLMR